MKVEGVKTMERVFAVFYEGSLLITIQARPGLLLDHVLDAYSERYAFERRKLTGTIVDYLPLNDVIGS